jgi:hypothetical protein
MTQSERLRMPMVKGCLNLIGVLDTQLVGYLWYRSTVILAKSGSAVLANPNPAKMFATPPEISIAGRL